MKYSVFNPRYQFRYNSCFCLFYFFAFNSIFSTSFPDLLIFLTFCFHAFSPSVCANANSVSCATPKTLKKWACRALGCSPHTQPACAPWTREYNSTSLPFLFTAFSLYQLRPDRLLGTAILFWAPRRGSFAIQDTAEIINWHYWTILLRSQITILFPCSSGSIQLLSSSFFHRKGANPPPFENFRRT